MSSSTSPSPGGASKIGYIRRAHGIKGAVIVRVVDDEVERFRPGLELQTDNPEYPQVPVATVQPHKDGLLVAFDGINDRNLAELLVGTSLLVSPEDRRALGEDEYWPEQLVGLRVLDPEGRPLGVVSDLVVGVAQDRLVVATDEADVEVPFVAALVTAVDLDGGTVLVDPPDGLF